MTKSSNLVTYTRLIYEVIRSYPANFMKLSPLFMEIWSFETVHCLNFNTQCQKHHDVTNDVKVNLMICGFVGYIKTCYFLLTYFFIILSMCAMEFADKLTLIHFYLCLYDLKTIDHTLNILTVAKVKLLPWKHMA